MEFKLNKKVFAQGPVTLKTTVSFQKKMAEALADIQKQTGQSVPEIVCDVLEQYLVHLANSNQIPWPDDKGKAS